MLSTRKVKPGKVVRFILIPNFQWLSEDSEVENFKQKLALHGFVFITSKSANNQWFVERRCTGAKDLKAVKRYLGKLAQGWGSDPLTSWSVYDPDLDTTAVKPTLQKGPPQNVVTTKKVQNSGFPTPRH